MGGVSGSGPPPTRPSHISGGDTFWSKFSFGAFFCWGIFPCTVLWWKKPLFGRRRSREVCSMRPAPAPLCCGHHCCRWRDPHPPADHHCPSPDGSANKQPASQSVDSQFGKSASDILHALPLPLHCLPSQRLTPCKVIWEAMFFEP